MRFLTRALGGALLFALGAVLLALGAMRLVGAMSPEEAAEAPARAAEERVFTVAGDVIALGSVRPVLTAYGEIRSWRTLRLGADAAGRVTWLSPGFRDGARVAEGELLLRLDPTPYEAAVAEARAALAEAEADRREAEAGLESARIERDSARAQAELRRGSLERQQGLVERGVASASAGEEAELALAAAEQTAASRRQAVVAAELRIDRAALARDRAGLALEEARRALGETELRAPFAGLLTEVAVGLGDLATAGATVAELLDPAALEAAITLSNTELARLRAPDGGLVPAAVALSLETGAPPVARATLDRAAAQAEAGGAARRVFARLESGEARLRPGDFVIARIEEPALDAVAVAPAAAVDEAGRLLVIDAESRLREVETTVLRRQGDEVILAGAPDGAVYVTERAPQLGPGVKVEVAEPAGAAAPAGPRVALDPVRRERLIDFLRGAALDEARRAELLEALARPDPSPAALEAVEALMRAARG